MILLQAMVFGGTGYALGMGMAAAFFASFLNYLPNGSRHDPRFTLLLQLSLGWSTFRFTGSLGT